MTSPSHYSVLLKESVDSLITDPNGIYIDGTFGRGGHSRAILSELEQKARLIAFDKDPQAIDVGNALQNEDARFSIEHDSFANMEQVARREQYAGLVDGILLDLGVSSPQLDQAERGFSFIHDGPLDMRMDCSKGQSAADFVNTAKQEDIAKACAFLCSEQASYITGECMNVSGGEEYH